MKIVVLKPKVFSPNPGKYTIGILFKKELLPASINQDFEISFPTYDTIESQTLFHKLYQIRFTELIFGNWSGISELLAEYFKLASEFDRDIDFRRRVFNRLDLRNSRMD